MKQIKGKHTRTESKYAIASTKIWKNENDNAVKKLHFMLTLVLQHFLLFCLITCHFICKQKSRDVRVSSVAASVLALPYFCFQSGLKRIFSPNYQRTKTRFYSWRGTLPISTRQYYTKTTKKN